MRKVKNSSMFTPRQHSNSYPNISPLVYEESIEFRAYQKNISDSAYNKNTLVILPTALGKTIIAIMIAARALCNYRHKRVLVIAPTRPHVVQHMKSFFSVLKITQEQVAEITGKKSAITKNNKDIRLIFATPEVVSQNMAKELILKASLYNMFAT